MLTTVDPDTVPFAGAPPVRWTMEDLDGDGNLDLLFHFKMQELSLTNDSTRATLPGTTYGRQAIEGTDTVNTVLKTSNSPSPALPIPAAPDSCLQALR